MSKQTVPTTDHNNVTSATNAVSASDVLTLMDNMGLNVVLHTHHPLTHLEYGNEVPSNSFTNTRNECPESPMALLSKEGIGG
jgi:hypothetical protein